MPEKKDITDINNKRTNKQSRALHKLFTDISNHCVSVGLDQKTVVNKLEAYSCPTSPAFVKSVWKAIQVSITGKESTTEITTQEVDQVYEVFSKFWAEITGEHFRFPSFSDAIQFYESEYKKENQQDS